MTAVRMSRMKASGLPETPASRMRRKSDRIPAAHRCPRAVPEQNPAARLKMNPVARRIRRFPCWKICGLRREPPAVRVPNRRPRRRYDSPAAVPLPAVKVLTLLPTSSGGTASAATRYGAVHRMPLVNRRQRRQRRHERNTPRRGAARIDASVRLSAVIPSAIRPEAA